MEEKGKDRLSTLDAGPRHESKWFNLGELIAARSFDMNEFTRSRGSKQPPSRLLRFFNSHDSD